MQNRLRIAAGLLAVSAVVAGCARKDTEEKSEDSGKAMANAPAAPVDTKAAENEIRAIDSVYFAAVNAKDAINATGAGAFFNPLNFGQMYGLHVMLLPIAITLLVVLHVVQVRLRYPDWGARKLQVVLAREGVELPRNTIHRILLRHALVHPEDRHEPAVERFERSAPRDEDGARHVGDPRTGADPASRAGQAFAGKRSKTHNNCG